ncbi:hypothetical protein [Enterovibrio sp. 27052020O]|uniref:hypothetical protein n=1 Tax=Enterovibrio sp. 27052020O TaxID=3241166 RepID=UPI00388FDD40
MKFKKFGMGNGKEAFFESRLNEKVNVIYSDDNNRGKTLLLQGMLYSIGNNPIFPEGFDYKDYTFYSLIEMNGSEFHFVRKNSSFIVKSDDGLSIFDSEQELRRYLSKFYGKIPKVNKKGTDITVDLATLYETFFIGQDRRTPSGLIGDRYFNKEDFKSMLAQLSGIDRPIYVSFEELEIKNKIKELQNTHKSLLKKIKIISKNPRLASFTSKSKDNIDVEELRKRAREISDEILDKRKKRNKEEIRVSNLESLKGELSSLNRNMQLGEVICNECGSDKIIFKNKDLNFDVSNIEVRGEILSSISKNIESKNELIASLSHEINTLQSKLTKLEKESPPDIFQLAMFSDDIRTMEEFDKEAHEVTADIKEYQRQKDNLSKGVNDTKAQVAKFISEITDHMNEICREIDHDGRLRFDDIFSKQQTVYSGSDEQEYYFCRTLAINKKLNHTFPIIIDSFRDGELSTSKEMKMLDLYIKLGKQVILTSTLKSEEYSNNKYSNSNINAIDYSNHKNGKLLSKEYNVEFLEHLENIPGLNL